MYGEMSQFQEHMVRNAMKVCEFEHERAQERQANSVVLEASQEVRQLRHSEEAQSGTRQAWQEVSGCGLEKNQAVDSLAPAVPGEVHQEQDHHEADSLQELQVLWQEAGQEEAPVTTTTRVLFASSPNAMENGQGLPLPNGLPKRVSNCTRENSEHST